MHACLWNEPLQFSEKVAFAEFEWKDHNFLNIKTGEWDLTILLFSNWNYIVLDALETYIHEVSAYVCLKRATAGVWECHFCWIRVKISQFLNYKHGEWDLTILLFNYWNRLALGLLETCFLEVSVKMCLKRATPGSEGVVFTELDWKYHIFLNIKIEVLDLKVLFFNYWNGLVLGSV